ncbi:MAG: SusD/RagB family nutrient-binding outer membrane lipoprotein [Bacteroidetes bacterium]|nr:SusD/RagB family nutrient-binding outer membrane lipoprotein [Bacteroidota bacterium]
MKNILYKKVAATVCAITLMMLTNCTNLTNGLSTDPVNITDPSVIAISKYMTGAEISLIGIYEANIARMSGMWAGYFSGEDRQYAGIGSYVVSGQDFNTEWVTIYTAILNNTKIIKANAEPTGNFVSIGIAQAMEGMCIGLAADLWGDVPYSEVAQYPAITAPKFDTQTSVYAAAQSLLDQAIVNLGKAGNAPGDFLLNGNKSAWIAVAHTIKARLYLHTRDYASALGQAAQGISNVSGNLMATHGNAVQQNFNLYYSFLTYDRSSYMGANSYAPKLLDKKLSNSRNNAKTDETARLNYYYYPGGGLNISGISYEPNVLTADDATAGWGNDTAHDGFFGAETPFPIASFEENQLILAEAYSKTADPTNALTSLNSLRTYYNTGSHVGPGYKADYAYKYLPYVYADFAPGGIENADNIAQDAALLREILEERYVTFIGQIEGYNDMRRTHNLLSIPLVAGKTNFPQRALYSQIEVNTNPNVPASGVGLYDQVNAFSTAY